MFSIINKHVLLLIWSRAFVRSLKILKSIFYITKNYLLHGRTNPGQPSLGHPVKKIKTVFIVIIFDIFLETFLFMYKA